MTVRLSDHLPNISRTYHQIYLTPGRCIVGDPRTGSVKFGAAWGWGGASDSNQLSEKQKKQTAKTKLKVDGG